MYIMRIARESTRTCFQYGDWWFIFRFVLQSALRIGSGRNSPQHSDILTNASCYTLITISCSLPSKWQLAPWFELRLLPLTLWYRDNSTTASCCTVPSGRPSVVPHSPSPWRLAWENGWWSWWRSGGRPPASLHTPATQTHPAAPAEAGRQGQVQSVLTHSPLWPSM